MERLEDMIARYGEVCSQKTAARIMNVQTRTIRRMLDNGKLRRVHHHVDVRSIAAYIREREQAMTENEIRLFAAAEAAKILHVNRSVVYTLWEKGLLDFWKINGTQVTNLNAIQEFLERTKNKALLTEEEAV